ncbi:hypothetical protein HHL16_04200 [Pseudoflavitalea sp. G-6-1-2]|uniref:Trm112 family protein n=1 Tax=Pseudoflavitalea sp. G-6-1-2 TaxID=2728841 RepID=UPI00146AB0F8|nr:Trm112 family protein [Pseudoflavitalea sp. G-6-1-2]NML20060.1 hypothetical protein [Pseudoflavitalea sp. G-6-1-2]
MHPDFLQQLCCPFDKKDLSLKIFATDTNHHIVEGLLTCEHCKRYYPIIHGVPIMSPDEYREWSLEAPVVKKWEAKLEGKKLDLFRLEDAPAQAN